MSGRIRLVVLTAAVFVLATLAVAPASAAVDVDSSTAPQLTDREDRRIDGNLSDGGVYWQGQRLGLGNLSARIAANETNISDVETLHLRRYDADDDELGTLVREIDVESGNQSLHTPELEGTYVLLPADQRTTVLQFANGSLNGTAAVDVAEPFEVLVQTLSVAWEPSPSDVVGSDRQIEVRSNRLRYNVNVSSPSMSYEELETAFMGDRFLRGHNEPFGDRRPFERRYRMYNVHADNDVIVLRGFSDGALRPDFGSLDRLPETVRVEVTDTGVVDRAVLAGEGVSGGPFNITRLEYTDEVDPGQQVTLRPTVTNEWRQRATRSITFELGEARTTSEYTLDPGESREITTTLPAPTEPGNVAYEVSTEGDSVTGTVIVREPPSSEETETSSETNETDSDDGTDSSGLINIRIGASQMGGIMTVLSLLTVVLFRRR